MISKGNHVKFARFVLLAVSECQCLGFFSTYNCKTVKLGTSTTQNKSDYLGTLQIKALLHLLSQLCTLYTPIVSIKKGVTSNDFPKPSLLNYD